ncbi:hypothetical protein, partial [Chryseobacterium arthrosphaerae]|uniref:hypothetical protein n=1 Tax=Chryseobacterium arthrosphaerae TaxID=651561 RepID=UPI0024153D99
VIYYIGDINKSESYYLKLLKFIIYNSASFLCILFLQFSWTKYFVDGVKNRKSKIEYKNENEESFISYNQLISQQQKWKLYEGLLKYSFINENTSKEEFENKFLTEPIELFMDVPSFREFYNLLLNKEKELRVLKPNIFVTFFINYKTKKIYNLKQFGKVSTPTSRVSEELQDMISNL